jgi:hypothetical protein
MGLYTILPDPGEVQVLCALISGVSRSRERERERSEKKEAFFIRSPMYGC